jgi:MFS family permease
MFIYFVGFNILEASLPSMISRQASAMSKGTAMGIYSSSQFLGIFAGGAIAGVIYQFWGSQGIFIVNSAIGLVWSVITFYIQPQAYQLTIILHYDSTAHNAITLSSQLSTLPGVHEVAVSEKENTIYLRIDKALYQNGSANLLIK